MKKINPLNMPKQDEVEEFDLGNNKVKLIEVTPENKDYLVEMALSMYLGEKCKYCLHEFKSNQDLRDRKAVYAGYHEYGRLACKKCWDENNPIDSVSTKE